MKERRQKRKIKFYILATIKKCIYFSLFIYVSYLIIDTIIDDYENSSISLVIENLKPTELQNFPSVAACEIGYTKETYSGMENLMEEWKKSESMEYNYDVEDFMLRLVFHNLYNHGPITPFCLSYMGCSSNGTCIGCPDTGYINYANKIRASCDDMFHECIWNNESFNCCKYFLPIPTTVGKCYMINSIQTAVRETLNMQFGTQTRSSTLYISFKKATSTYVLNREEIPHILLTSMEFLLVPEGYSAQVFLAEKHNVNDAETANVDPQKRSCRLPTETSYSQYTYYSYSVCATECLKKIQLNLCNCFHHNFIVKDNDLEKACNLSGITCLDKTKIMSPRTTTLQKWSEFKCDCFQSCEESEFKIISQSSSTHNSKNRILNLTVDAWPTIRYRRQIVRKPIDLVVSIGGIVSLLIGASVLNLIEVILYVCTKYVPNHFKTIKELVF